MHLNPGLACEQRAETVKHEGKRGWTRRPRRIMELAADCGLMMLGDCYGVGDWEVSQRGLISLAQWQPTEIRNKAQN